MVRARVYVCFCTCVCVTKSTQGSGKLMFGWGEGVLNGISTKNVKMVYLLHLEYGRSVISQHRNKMFGVLKSAPKWL